MKELYPLSGVVAIPQTPFDDDDRVDLDSFARGVLDRLAAGVDGLLYPVVASEVSRLTEAERRTLTLAVLEQAAGHVPVFVGASADDVADGARPRRVRRDARRGGRARPGPVALLRDEAATVAWFRAVCEAPIEVLMIQDLEWGVRGCRWRRSPACSRSSSRSGASRSRRSRPAEVHGDPRGDRRAAHRGRGLGGPVPDGGARPRDPRRDAGRPALADRGGGPPPSRGRCGGRAGPVRSAAADPRLAEPAHRHLEPVPQAVAVRQGIFAGARLRRPDVPSTPTIGASPTS